MSRESGPLLVEVVAYAPTAFYHCTHCELVWQQTGFSRGLHEEQVRSALPPDLQADYQAVSSWVRELVRRHGDNLVIKVIDAASLEGVWRSLRRGLSRYPAVVVGGQQHYLCDFEAAENEIARRLAAWATATRPQKGR